METMKEQLSLSGDQTQASVKKTSDIPQASMERAEEAVRQMEKAIAKRLSGLGIKPAEKDPDFAKIVIAI